MYGRETAGKTSESQAGYQQPEDRYSNGSAGRSFDLNEILLETEQGMLMVKGTDMHVNRLNLEKGEVDLAGNIDNISYSDIHSGAKAGENLLSKLFR